MDEDLLALLRQLQIEAPEAWAGLKPYIDAWRDNPTDPVLRTTVPFLILNWMRTFRPDLVGVITRLTSVLSRATTALGATTGAGGGTSAAGVGGAGGGLGAGVIAGVGALAQALLLFGAGVALPAAHWGELEFDNPFTAGDRRRAAAAKLRDRLAAHRRQRDRYRRTPSATGRRELHNDAEALYRELRAFISWWTGSAEAAALAEALAQIEAWIEEYVNGGPPPMAAPAPAPTPVTPPPVRPAPPPAPPPPVPPTIAAPPSLEWSEGEHIRKTVKYWRDRLRKLYARQREAEEWEVEYRKELRRQIDEAIEALEKLRAQAAEIGQDTGEEWDEPLDPPGPLPPPHWPLGHDWEHPEKLYVDPETGKQDFFSDPPPGWRPALGPDLKPLFRPGWVLTNDPETSRPKWVKGMVPVE